jgi:uncharacterized protein
LLKKFIAEKGMDGVVVAFSGGVDSSTLAAICHEVLGDRVVAVIAQSPTYSTAEMADAKKIAQSIGIPLYVVETNELKNPDFIRNPENRCYFCKKELLQTLLDYAHKLGFRAVFEGTNHSDLSGHRPGLKAIRENPNVYSPWMETGFSKEEIRQVAKQKGLSVADKPALACLASRIPFNVEITAEKLRRVEQAEQAVRAIGGAVQVRVRDHDGLARIEVDSTERVRFCSVEVMDKVAAALKQLGFKYVTVDLEGYQQGSMLKTLQP